MPVSHSQFQDAGKVKIDAAACSNCGLCTEICPTGVLRMEQGRVAVHPESTFGCIACGHCMMVCPNGSVVVTGRALTPSDLAPLAPTERRADADTLANLMQARRSVRRFKEEEPARELLERIIQMAATGPMGIPPWDVGCVVVRGRQRVQELAGDIVGQYQGLLKIMKPWLLALAQPFMKKPAFEQMSSFILPLAQAYVEGRSQGRDLLFYDAPAVLIFHHSPYVDPSEAMIACTYAMLAAESLGLGSTMIGAAAPIMLRKPELCRNLGIPAANKPAIALIVGYPAVNFRRGITRRFASLNFVE